MGHMRFLSCRQPAEKCGNVILQLLSGVYKLQTIFCVPLLK